MKKIAFIIFVSSLSALTYSCKQCLSCQLYTGTADSMVVRVPYDDACGSKKDMRIFEDSIKNRTLKPYVDSTVNPPLDIPLNYICTDITDDIL